MAESKINDAIYPSIESAFKQKANVTKLEQMVATFIDKNNDQLSSIGPTKNILFMDTEKNKMYEITNTNPKTIKDAKNSSKDIKSAGLVMRDPFKSLMAVVLRYFSVNKDEKMVRLVTFYTGCSFYPSIYYKYFKYDPNPNIMEYTINNLSNKYKIKQLGSLMACIDDISYGAYLLHKDEIDKGSDYGIVQYILALQTRLNSFIKKIRNEFDKNHKSGAYLHTEFESNEKDNFREAESTMYIISRLVDKISLKLIVDGPPIKLINIAAKNNGVSVNELRNYVTTMVVNDKMKDIREIIECILLLYLINDQNTSEEINSDKFLLYCLDIYKRSNTTDENILKIKKILDSWLTELGTYKKTQRAASINNFRRALYTFFILSIQYYNVR